MSDSDDEVEAKYLEIAGQKGVIALYTMPSGEVRRQPVTGANWLESYKRDKAKYQERGIKIDFETPSPKLKRRCPLCGEVLQYDPDYADSDNKWVCPKCD